MYVCIYTFMCFILSAFIHNYLFISMMQASYNNPGQKIKYTGVFNQKGFRHGVEPCVLFG